MSSQRRTKECGGGNQIILPISTKNGLGRHEPSVEGHVALNRDNEKDGDIKMTLHFAVKNNNDQEKRSRSLPRQNSAKRFENDFRDLSSKNRDRNYKKNNTKDRHSSRPWGEILRETESPNLPNSYFQVLSGDDDGPGRSDRHTNNVKRHQKRHSTALEVQPTEFDDASSLSALNPTRTLQFLIGELQEIVKSKGEPAQKVFKMIEDTLIRMPRQFSPDFGKKRSKECNCESSSKHSNGVSFNKYELLRKDRDELHMKLDKMSRNQRSLERKLATAEAKTSRLNSELDELRTVNEKLLSDKKQLLASIPALEKQEKSSNLDHHLKNELTKAHTYIHSLEKTCGKIQEKYQTKLRVIQDVLSNGLDHQVRENPRITDIVGLSPLEDIEPLDYPNESIQAPSLISSKKDTDVEILSTSTTAAINAQKYIDRVMMNSGLLKPDQEHLFQSFQSIADQE